MGGRALFFVSLVLAFAGLGASARAAEKCDVATLGELRAEMSDLRARVHVKVNGTDETFLVDSGAFYSFIDTDDAERLKLPRSMAPMGFQVRGLGGAEDRISVATVRHFGIVGADLSNIQFLVAPAVDRGSAGILGQNVLNANDVEYDFANGIIRLMRPSAGCAHADLAYWAHGHDQVLDIERTDPLQTSIRGEAKVNGQTIRVAFDTGNPLSFIKRSTAERLGFRPDGPDVRAAGLTGGLGRHVSETWTAPFDSLEVGGEKILHTRLRVADVTLDNVDMLLGADFFLSHRIYISRQQHRMFFTYNGGPVFQLGSASTRTAAGGPAPAAASPPGGEDRYADVPTDAAGFTHRGEASMSRRDFAAALADFSKAADLEPNEPQHFRDRARAHLAMRQPVLAMADFDQALKLKPEDPVSLIGRGELYLASRDLGHAKTDFDAALRADPNRMPQVAAFYVATGNFEPAIAGYDAWIEAHPKSDNLYAAFNARCRARTMWNHDLDKALADCEAAMHRGPRAAALFETRGLTHLRRGELDLALADYNEALKLQPRLAWALYGRGLAKIGKGDKAGGEADLQAAATIAPNLAAQAKRFGLAPPGATVQAAAAGG